MSVSSKNKSKMREKEYCKTGIFTVEHSVKLKIFAIFSCAFLTICFTINCGNFLGVWEIGKNSTLAVIVIFGFLEILGIYVFMVVYIWKIYVNEDKIVYRNYIGIKKCFYFQDLEIYESHNEIIAYQNGKKVFKIGFLPLNQYAFLVRADYYGAYRI